jgi:hypothetical protein
VCNIDGYESISSRRIERITNKGKQIAFTAKLNKSASLMVLGFEPVDKSIISRRSFFDKGYFLIASQLPNKTGKLFSPYTALFSIPSTVKVFGKDNEENLLTNSVRAISVFPPLSRP